MELERQKGADKDEVPKAFVLETELGPHYCEPEFCSSENQE